MERSNVSLKWLEAFQAVGRFGSISEGAAQLGVSVSTVSQHISCLEAELGVALIDHAKRPMHLTTRGEVLLARVDEALSVLRRGIAGVSSDDLGSLMRLVRIAIIDDFDIDVSPFLIAHLSHVLPSCEFTHLSRPSHQVLALMQSEQADFGVAASAEIETEDLLEEPILRDPFLIVAPAGATVSASDLVAGRTDLQFLRYSREQMMGRRIDLHLRRLGLFLPAAIESESTHTILSMVAAERGWTVSTALNIARARRLSSRLRPLPFPSKGFSRTISLFRRETLPAQICESLGEVLRRAIETTVIAPLTASTPWLAGQIRVLARPETGGRAEAVAARPARAPAKAGRGPLPRLQ